MKITKLAEKAKSMLTLKPYQASNLSHIEQDQQNRRVSGFVLSSALVCLVAFEPSIAMADGLGNIQDVATNIKDALLGTFGRTVATLAVVVMGLMAMFGKLAWDHAIKVIFGIAIVFGAATIIDALTGTMKTGIAQ